VVALASKLCLTSFPLVGLLLLCYAMVTKELPTSINVVALHLALLVGRLAELPTSLSSDPAFESNLAAYIDNPAAILL
jgi:hypothetical protein